MALKKVILVNNALTDITIEDFGSVVVPYLGQLDVTGVVKIVELNNSLEFQNYVDNGDILINDGEQTLSVAASQSFSTPFATITETDPNANVKLNSDARHNQIHGFAGSDHTDSLKADVESKISDVSILLSNGAAEITTLTEVTDPSDVSNVWTVVEDGNAAFAKRKISLSNVASSTTTRKDYGPLTTDPTSPTPEDGDKYFNTTIQKEMAYDSTRGKWLSVETAIVYYGRTGNVNAGQGFRTIDGLAYTNTPNYIGFYLPWNATITGIGFTQDGTVVTTIDVIADGTSVATLNTGGATEGSTTDSNANATSGQVLGVFNQAGGNQIADVNGWVFLKWRA